MTRWGRSVTVQLAVGITQQQKAFEMRVFFSFLAFVFDAAHLFGIKWINRESLAGPTLPFEYLPVRLQQLSGFALSDDDEIDYSVKPEFYDVEMDDKDETWVLCKRQGRKSDALLSCPVCFTTLCIDCQRHEIYVTQYRAMFVMNCKVVENQRLRRPAESTRQKKDCKKRSNQYNRNCNSLPEDANEKLRDEVFKPVCCSVCETEVAVLDENEIYHFFNVMPSYA